MESLNRVTISRSALAHNFDLCRGQAGSAGVMAMVKADGYGHGMIECARLFAARGAVAFGVAEAVEGATLRRAGCDLPIFVLAGVVPQTAAGIVEHRLTPVVVDAAILPELSHAAVAQGVELPIHLKVDAGMGRQGTLPAAFTDLARTAQSLPGLRVEGVMAHFPMSEDRESTNSAEVLATFRRAAAGIAGLVGNRCCLHLANSGGLFYVAGARLDMVRLGIGLYGYYPDGAAGRAAVNDPFLQPVMRFVTSVIQVRQLPAGAGLGYNHLSTTTRPTTVAVLPVGYEDGYLRVLSNRAEVLLHGRRAPVIGRISMNLTLVDATNIDGVRVGDEAVLLGRQGEEEITADELAGWMETISYEVLCLFGNLNHRVLVD